MTALRLILLLAVGPMPGPAESVVPVGPPLEGVWDRVVGCWSGEGVLAGAPARFDMRWLARGELRVLLFENQSDASETPFHAVALYDPASATGSWQDSFGGRYDLSFEATDGEVVVEWRRRSGELMGSTRYTFPTVDEAEVIDLGLSGPEPVEFGRASYRRVDCE